ncbi:MAG TPA: biotin--[acetyl-CoA-carboxylase] ligase [Bacilli bacterium]|nr:biotin--[acetyl-CoA-carboxylase] ligase [Bacilli bacterium]
MYKIIEFQSLPSTNLYIKENYRSLANKTVVMANHQTAGRGRRGRVWQDSDDLLFSILLKKNLPESITNLSLLMAASLYKTLIKKVENVTIKWPNDILVNGKKLAGILLESVINAGKTEYVVIGVGINTNTEEIDASLQDKATSLYLETKAKVNKKELLRKIIRGFSEEYKLYNEGKSDYLQICRHHSSVIGREVTIIINNAQKTAKIVDILSNGNISLMVDDQQIEMNSGEITLTELY